MPRRAAATGGRRRCPRSRSAAVRGPLPRARRVRLSVKRRTRSPSSST
jgi:hypothetical protein